MVTMQMLRMMADLSFYYAFAGFIAVLFGGTGAMLALMVQCVCFGLSYLGRKRRGLRLALLLPIALCWLLHPSSPDRLVMIPAALYLIVQVFRGEYELSWDRQVSLFLAFWKLLILVVVVSCIMGHIAEVTAVMLPFGMIMLISSVVLMRSLRHDAQVYCQGRYQVLNLLTVAATAAMAFLMSTEVFLHACVMALKTIYTYTILPIFMLLLEGMMGLSQALSWLAQLFGFEGWQAREQQGEEGAMGAQEMDLGYVETTDNPWIKWTIIAVLTVATIAVLIAFFRWLSRRGRNRTFELSAEVQREEFTPQRKTAAPRDASPVRGVRAQYKRFLKLCTNLGVHLTPGMTSRDIDYQARRLPGMDDTSGKIREIYVRARYAGSATRQDVEQIKKLCAQAKKDTETQLN